MTVKNEFNEMGFEVNGHYLTINCKYLITGDIISTPTGRELEGIEVEIYNIEMLTYGWHNIDIWKLTGDDWEYYREIYDELHRQIKRHIYSDIRWYFLGEDE